MRLPIVLISVSRFGRQKLGIAYAEDMNTTSASVSKHHDGGALSGALAGISFVASLVALNALSDAPYPMPGAKSAEIRRYFSQEHRAARLGAIAQLICAGSLAQVDRSSGRAFRAAAWRGAPELSTS